MAKVPEVLVVDQDPQARFEIKQLVKHAHLTLAGEGGLGTESVSLATEVRPDVILCAISDPPERSVQTIASLLDHLPETPIIVYSRQQDIEMVRQAMLAGARDFLTLPVDPSHFLASVSAVLESEEKKRLRQDGQQAVGAKGLVITVYGTKGGIGKTTLATNLGIALASTLGQSVVIVDADTSFGDVASMLDLRATRTVIDLLRDVENVEPGSVTEYLTEHPSGLRVLPAPRESVHWLSVTPERLRKAIGLLAKRFDVVLIDAGSQLAEVSLTAMEESNIVLWVTSSEFTSINNSILGLETIQKVSFPEAKIRLVLSVVSADDGMRPGKIEQALGRQFFWHVPYDRELRMGTQTGQPGVTGDPSRAGGQRIMDLGQVLVGIARKSKPKSTPNRQRLFSRFFRPAASPAEGRP